MNAELKTLLREIEDQKALMVSVATGGPQIKAKNAEYTARRLIITQALADLGIEDPNTFSDLWGWYAKWSSGELPTWASRRKYIADLYTPLTEAVMAHGKGKKMSVAEPTGWSRVDRCLDKIREALERAKNEEDFQAVGLYCRETLISAASEVFVPLLHCGKEDAIPSSTDSIGMLELFIACELQGSSNEVLRNYAKSTAKLANQLVHRRTATVRDAMLSSEATRATVNLIAIIAGKRG